MTPQPSRITARFGDHANAELAVAALHQAGFPSAEITAAPGTPTPAPGDEPTVWAKVKHIFSADPYADESGASRTTGVIINPVAEMDDFTSDYSNSIRGLSFTEAPVTEAQTPQPSKPRTGDAAILVTVNASDRDAQVNTILQQHHAISSTDATPPGTETI